jgi:hypothetical protein
MSIQQQGKTLIRHMSEAMRQSGAVRKLCEARNTTSPEIAVRDTIGGAGALFTFGYCVISNSRREINERVDRYNRIHIEPITDGEKYETVKAIVAANIGFGALTAAVWPLYWTYRGIAWGINKTV